MICAALLAAAPAQAELLRLPTRPGVTLPVAIEAPAEPAVAWALLFSGGDGALHLNAQGAPTTTLGQLYLTRSHQHLIAAGIGVVMVDVPSDQRAGTSRIFRRSAEHMADVGALVRTLRQRFGRPVWIVGHSNGTMSAENAARSLAGPERPDGLVLTSSTIVQARPSPGDPVSPFPYTGPVLIIAHEKDGCSVSPPGDAPILLAAFPSARPKAMRIFTGGSPARGHPCHALSAHSFIGIEAEVMAAIAAFIHDQR